MDKTNEGEVEQVEADIAEHDEAEDQDTTDWKTKHDELLAELGRVKREKTKLEKQKTEKKEEKQEKGLDRMDKAILRLEKITSADEISLVEDLMSESGKTLEQVLESKFFQHELKELRDARATKEATPSGTKRSGQSPRTEVDYWIAKGEMPPADQPELRRAYVNKKMEKSGGTNRFSDQSVII